MITFYAQSRILQLVGGIVWLRDGHSTRKVRLRALRKQTVHGQWRTLVLINLSPSLFFL